MLVFNDTLNMGGDGGGGGGAERCQDFMWPNYRFDFSKRKNLE